MKSGEKSSQKSTTLSLADTVILATLPQYSLHMWPIQLTQGTWLNFNAGQSTE